MQTSWTVSIEADSARKTTSDVFTLSCCRPQSQQSKTLKFRLPCSVRSCYSLFVCAPPLDQGSHSNITSQGARGDLFRTQRAYSSQFSFHRSAEQQHESRSINFRVGILRRLIVAAFIFDCSNSIWLLMKPTIGIWIRFYGVIHEPRF